MVPTDENIRDVATARIKAIRQRAHELDDNESSDERLIGIVVQRAIEYANRPHHPAETAQAAVAWSILDMHSVEAPR